MGLGFVRDLRTKDAASVCCVGYRRVRSYHPLLGSYHWEMLSHTSVCGFGKRSSSLVHLLATSVTSFSIYLNMHVSSFLCSSVQLGSGWAGGI